MNDAILSVFVDESGNFSYPDEVARFYIITLVLHSQSDSVSDLVAQLDSRLADLKLNNHCFHAGPIIRREEGYEYMNWELRTHIFSLMMAFLRKAPIRYAGIVVDKKYVSSSAQILDRLRIGLDDSLSLIKRVIGTPASIKVYYDCGQATVTQLLHEATESAFGSSVEFAQGVRPADYKLFQLADLICSLTLIGSKLDAGIPMSSSESKFFGGPRNFKRCYLRQLKLKML